MTWEDLDGNGEANALPEQAISWLEELRGELAGLMTWLREPINLVLAGYAQIQPRPTGILIEQGHFEQEGVRVWAYDWYWRGKRVAVAHCGDSAVAWDLADKLNRLLGWSPA